MTGFYNVKLEDKFQISRKSKNFGNFLNFWIRRDLWV